MSMVHIFSRFFCSQLRDELSTYNAVHVYAKREDNDGLQPLIDFVEAKRAALVPPPKPAVTPS
jgi:hypothetical protein